MSSDTKVLEVVIGLNNLILADDAIITALGGEHLFERMTSDIRQIPGIYWYLLPSLQGEVYESAIVRFELWAKGTAAVFALERLVRRRCHFELPTELNGVVTFCTFRQSFDASDAEEQHDDDARRIVEFEIQPVRLRRT